MNGELLSPEQNAIAALNRSEIDSQIATAKAYPRDEVLCLRKAEKLATMSPEVAGEMFYVLKRGNTSIEGPSVRLAEVVASTWGNLRTGARVVEINDKFLTAQGICHDLETNTCHTANVERRITDKNGRKYRDDMIQTTAAAACAIAQRNAIFKVIPMGLLKPIYEKAKNNIKGDTMSLQDRWNQAVQYWAKFNITEEQLLEYLSVTDPASINGDHIVAIRGLANAIKGGEESLENAFNLKVQTKGSKAQASDALGPELPASLQSMKKKLDNVKDAMELADLCSKVSNPDDYDAAMAYGEWAINQSKSTGELFNNQPHHE